MNSGRVTIYDYGVNGVEVTGINRVGRSKSGGRRGSKYSEVSLENRKLALRRAKRNFRRIVLANNLFRHLVLTVREDNVEVELWDARFKKFIYVLRNEYGYKNLRYVAVREFQERGAIHYHVLINQYVPYEVIRDVWKYGYISIMAHKNIYLACFYVSKYILKEVEGNQDRLITRRGNRMKVYLSSRGLKEEVKKRKKTYIVRDIDKFIDDVFSSYDSLYSYSFDLGDGIFVRSDFYLKKRKEMI